MEDFRLLMVSAMYENGGNAVHRLLDGHPQMFVYPFESQLGTKLVVDHLASVFPVKYRWPVFPLEGSPIADFRAIIDEECKVRARTPHVSKFRHFPFDLDDDERGVIYEDVVRGAGRSRGGNVAAFFRATFRAWKDRKATGGETTYVGYSPIVVVDGDKILADFPQAHVLHVVRNPWSAYADHLRRPVPLPLPAYFFGWTLCQRYALLFRERFPERVHIVRFEDIADDPRRTLGQLCKTLGLEATDSLATASWNGRPLPEIFPWGTIRTASAAANQAAADELTEAQREEVSLHAQPYLEPFGYDRRRGGP